MKNSISMLAVSIALASSTALAQIFPGDSKASTAKLDEARLRHSDPLVRSGYALSIGKIEPRVSIPALRKLLMEDKSEDVQLSAARSLASMAHPQGEPVLIEAVRSRASLAVRVEAIRGLSSIGSGSSLDFLISVTADSTPQIRSAAIAGLGQRGDPKALSTVVKYIQDDNPSVAARAAWALGEFGDKAAIPPLLVALKDGKAPEIRQESALALARIRDPQVAPTLATYALSRGENLGVRIAAIKALTRVYTQDKTAVDLTPLVRDESPQIRAASAFSIATSERGDIIPAMQTLVKDGQADVRGAAVIAMGLRPSRFSSLLADVAADRKATDALRIAALTALSEVTPSELAGEFIYARLGQLLSTAESVDLQISGIRMLARVGTESARAAIRRFGDQPNLDAKVRAAVASASK